MEKLRPWEKLEGLLPPLSIDEEIALKESVVRNGVLVPIKVLPDGRIVDGFHRWKLSNGEPPFEILNVNEDEAFELAIKLNTSRRHLSGEQKRELILTLRRQGYSQEKVSQLTGFSRALVGGVEKLEEFNDDKTVKAKPFDLRIKIPDREYPRIYERAHREPVGQIAADYKVTPGRISQIVQHHKKELDRKASIEELTRRAGTLSPLESEFSVIVIDPPWPSEGDYDPQGRRGTPPYPIMDVEEIEDLKIPAADNCVLWLWTTTNRLHDAFHVLEKWGFVSKNVLTWAKGHIGLGKWLRGQTEHCILAVRGSPRIKLTDQSTLLYAPGREHSRKPDEFYQMVDSLCEGPKLDYFGRERRDGWVIYGTKSGSEN